MPNNIELFPEDRTYPKLSFFDGKEAILAYKEELKQYEERAQRTLDVFGFEYSFEYSLIKHGLVRGSNPFAVVKLASSKLALPSQIEHAVRRNPGFFVGHYEDIALVLRTSGDDEYKQNDYIARHLAKQVKKRTGIVPNPYNPVRISLKGLSVEEDNDSGYGLVFLLGDETEVLYIPELSDKNDRKKFSKTDKQGIPIFEDDGSRTFYSRTMGLSRLSLFDKLGLASCGSNLLESNADGRVAIICAT